MSDFRNGDKVIETCYFCGMRFEEPQALGDAIECAGDLGCGVKFTVKVAQLKSKKKAKVADQYETEDE